MCPVSPTLLSGVIFHYTKPNGIAKTIISDHYRSYDSIRSRIRKVFNLCVEGGTPVLVTWKHLSCSLFPGLDPEARDLIMRDLHCLLEGRLPPEEFFSEGDTLSSYPYGAPMADYPDLTIPVDNAKNMRKRVEREIERWELDPDCHFAKDDEVLTFVYGLLCVARTMPLKNQFVSKVVQVFDGRVRSLFVLEIFSAVKHMFPDIPSTRSLFIARFRELQQQSVL